MNYDLVTCKFFDKTLEQIAILTWLTLMILWPKIKIH